MSRPRATRAGVGTPWATAEGGRRSRPVRPPGGRACEIPAQRRSAGARLLLLVAVLAGLLPGMPAGPALAQDEPPVPDAPLVATVPADWPQAPPVTAEAWVLVEGATGQVLAERRSRQRRPVASTVKILTALTALERTEPDEVVTVGQEVEVAGASVGLEPGDEWTVQQLLAAVVARSGNDAAQALATHVAGGEDAFVDHMRAEAAALGLTDVELTEATGLDDGNALSARDLALLARVALADEELRPLLARETVALPGVGEVASRNQLLGAYPGATGVKTGFTAQAGYCLVASARRDGRELVAVVLASDEDPARFEDAAGLLDHGFEAFEPVALGRAWRLPVGGGARHLEVPEETVTVPAASRHALRPLPPSRVRRGPVALDLVVDGRAVADVEGEIRGGPGPARSSHDLGRSLAGEAHAAMRAATRLGAW